MTLCPRSEILGPLGNFLRVEVSEVRPGHPKPIRSGAGSPGSRDRVSSM